MENTEKTNSEKLGEFFGTIGAWFLSAAFMLWGWNVIARYCNLPQLTYWEVFAIRMGFSSIMAMIVRPNRKN